jgi:hypothetical protein
MYTISLANYVLGIELGNRIGDGSRIARRIEFQIPIVNNVSLRITNGNPILLDVSLFMISVTKLKDMIIHLCMCNSSMGNMKVLDSKSS